MIADNARIAVQLVSLAASYYVKPMGIIVYAMFIYAMFATGQRHQKARHQSVSAKIRTIICRRDTFSKPQEP